MPSCFLQYFRKFRIFYTSIGTSGLLLAKYGNLLRRTCCIHIPGVHRVNNTDHVPGKGRFGAAGSDICSHQNISHSIPPYSHIPAKRSDRDICSSPSNLFTDLSPAHHISSHTTLRCGAVHILLCFQAAGTPGTCLRTCSALSRRDNNLPGIPHNMPSDLLPPM